MSTMTWKQLAEKISLLTEEQQAMPVISIVMGDVVSAPFIGLEVAPLDKELMRGLNPGQPFMFDE